MRAAGTAVAGDNGGMDELDLSADVVDLTAAVCDVTSVSRDEARLADLVEAALRRPARPAAGFRPRLSS